MGVLYFSQKQTRGGSKASPWRSFYLPAYSSSCLDHSDMDCPADDSSGGIFGSGREGEKGGEGRGHVREWVTCYTNDPSALLTRNKGCRAVTQAMASQGGQRSARMRAFF
ncbi:hypothetical protein CDAR_186061 [Caerostris darwini]|uniref:Uncharacterized protein n=1 Tax=Caerostris darwini TaxID=1538125 RepID=A0AAV4WW87_9ARAC|nr:hypothetical protein CDAR_186061 [Caerostris darwini]